MGFLKPKVPPPPPPASPAPAVVAPIDVQPLDPYSPITADDIKEGQTVKPDSPMAATSITDAERRRLARKRGRYGKATILTGPQGLLGEAEVTSPTLIGGAKKA